MLSLNLDGLILRTKHLVSVVAVRPLAATPWGRDSFFSFIQYVAEKWAGQAGCFQHLFVVAPGLDPGKAADLRQVGRPGR
jgi:hypothetical protein